MLMRRPHTHRPARLRSLTAGLCLLLVTAATASAAGLDLRLGIGGNGTLGESSDRSRRGMTVFGGLLFDSLLAPVPELRIGVTAAYDRFAANTDTLAGVRFIRTGLELALPVYRSGRSTLRVVLEGGYARLQLPAAAVGAIQRVARSENDVFGSGGLEAMWRPHPDGMALLARLQFTDVSGRLLSDWQFVQLALGIAW